MEDNVIDFIVAMTGISMAFILGILIVILFGKLAKEEQKLKNEKLKLDIKYLKLKIKRIEDNESL